MVGYGTSLRRSRRHGWEAAYLDYESLKLLLTHIEAVYEEGGHRWGSAARAAAAAGCVSPAHFEFAPDSSSGMLGGGTAGGDEERGRGSRHRDKGGPAAATEGGDYRDEIFLESDPDRAFASGSSEGSDYADDSSSDDGEAKGGSGPGIAGKGVAGGGILPADANFSFSYSNEARDELSQNDLARMQMKLAMREEEKDSSFLLGEPSGYGGYSALGTSGFVDEQGQEVAFSPVAIKGASVGGRDTERNGLLRPTDSGPKRVAGEPYHGISFQNFLGNVHTAAAPMDSSAGGADGFIFHERENGQVFWRQELGAGRKRRKEKGCLPFGTGSHQLSKAEAKKKKRRAKAKRRRRKRARVPAHLRAAHSKARAITERFLGLLKAETEKVSLFAHSRMGELAETIGSLRFPAESGYGESRLDHPLSDGGMHPSASSSSDDGMRGRSFSWSSSSDDGQENKTPVLSRARQGDGSGGSLSAASMSNAHSSAKRRRGSRGKPRSDNPARRKIEQSERLRQQRPMFQRSDQVVGEDFLLLSAVDEADAYTAVGVELMHLLKFICVNTIAVRKICKKHDRLAKNRMLGGYYHKYHKERSQLAEQRKTRRGRRGHSQRSVRDGNVADNQPLLGGVLSGALSGGVSGINKMEKLVGMIDVRIQNLANSGTAQMISSSLALALSEYEVTQDRADALARLNTTPKRRGYASPNESVASNDGGGIESSLCYPFPQPRSFGVSPSRGVKTSLIKRMQSDEGDGSSHESAMSTNSDVSLMRLKYVVTSVYALREAARIKRNKFKDFLSRSAMTYTGPNVAGEGIDGCSRETLDFLVVYNPDSALLLDPPTLHRSLQLDKTRPSMYGIMTASLAVALTDLSSPHSQAVVDEDTVSNAVTLMPRPCDFDPLLGSEFTDTGKWRRTISVVGDYAVQRSTLRLNFTSIFLYSVNYYIISPSARSYALLLGSRPAYSASLIGIASMSSFLSALLHSRILQKNVKIPLRNGPAFFRLPLLLSALCALVGNLLYGRAHWHSSMYMALFGRFLIGFGSAEVLNRQLISKCVPAAGLVTETARLVRASMVGVFVGPLIGTIFSVGESDVVLDGTVVIEASTASAPGYFMAALWLMQIFGLVSFFQEPDKHHPLGVEESVSKENIDVDSPTLSREKQTEDFNSDTSVSDGGACTPEPPIGKSLLYHQSSLDVRNASHTNRDVGSHKKPKRVQDKKSLNRVTENSHQKRSIPAKIRRIRRLVFCNVALPVTISILAFTKFTHEILFSSCSVITRRYFGWYSAMSGVPLIAFGGLILPINYLIESLARSRGERTIMKVRSS
mmetsp:Transcript_62977/g.186007  ORF Transcript_62977/g.186007 Transcript_62977/m.186007 type:complete len:1313 (-) Transcript_62977:828-4766(-)